MGRQLLWTGQVRVENGRRHVHQHSETAAVHREPFERQEEDLRKTGEEVEADSEKDFEVLRLREAVQELVVSRLHDRSGISDDFGCDT